MSGSWDGTVNKYINMTSGNAGAVSTGAFSIVTLFKPSAGNSGLISLRNTSSGDNEVRAFLQDSFHLYAQNDFSAAGFGTTDTTNWWVGAVRKQAGSVNYRYSLWQYASDGSGTMSHGTSGFGSGDNAATTNIYLGGGPTGTRGSSLIALAGLYDAFLDDTAMNTLRSANASAWAALSPKELISLQNWNGSTGVDTLVGSSSFVAVTGGTIAAGANPPGFNFSLGPSGPGGQAGAMAMFF